MSSIALLGESSANDDDADKVRAYIVGRYDRVNSIAVFICILLFATVQLLRCANSVLH